MLIVEVILYGIGVFQVHMMNKSQVGTRLLSVYIDTVGAIHVIVPTFALERGEEMAVLNTHLSDLQESVKQLSPMFKDDKVVTLV